MKIKIIFIAICSVVLIGCGSGKNVVKSAPKKVIVVANEEHTIKLPQLEQINKNIKILAYAIIKKLFQNDFKERFLSIKSKSEQLIQFSVEGINWLEKHGSTATKQGKKQLIKDKLLRVFIND